MNIKYRNKIYKSEDLPIFIFFKTDGNRKEFINILEHYKAGTFCRINCVHSILAGNTVIKDKRSPIFFNIEDKEEKRTLQRSLFDNDVDDNNAMMCSPSDTKEDNLISWVEKNLDNLL